ncbi:MAG: hypothetical protein DWQ01_08450 [Planctomycetota bacterium]|nr:MAG: hypothetical protein DWQ01_08450 [Planctomycetota bacterium]
MFSFRKASLIYPLLVDSKPPDKWTESDIRALTRATEKIANNLSLLNWLIFGLPIFWLVVLLALVKFSFEGVEPVKNLVQQVSGQDQAVEETPQAKDGEEE